MSFEAFAVPLGRHLTSGFVHATRPLWKWLGNLETTLVANEIADTKIEAPIYVAGLARAGTTVLLEVIASHPSVATHQYRDFPFLFTPFFWQQTLQRSAPKQLEAAERAHGDRLMVTAASPEAMEEVLWMAFFDHLHDPRTSNLLDRSTQNPRFEAFYRDHIRKVVAVHQKSRYAAKENYNVVRLPYLHKLFADARFVVPIRHPREHIASLMKQHQLFCGAGAEHPRAIKHLERVGHFEFGPHRRLINTGDTDLTQSIEDLWAKGEEVRGWARYWAAIHQHVADVLAQDSSLRDATLVIRYEDLCDDTDHWLAKLLDHCRLDDPKGRILSQYGGDAMSRPKYYKASFTQEDERAISEETREVSALFGYP